MNRPLRVLETITPSKIGGAEVSTTSFSSWLKANGDFVQIFCPSGRPYVGYASKRGHSPITWKTYGKIDPATVIKLAMLARRLQADVIHTHLSTASLLSAFAGKLAKIPTVAHAHGMNSPTCFRFSDRVIAVSEAAKRHLVGQGMPEAQVTVVHNGIDISTFAPGDKNAAKAAAGLGENESVLGIFGRLSPEKGHAVAVEAFAQTLREYCHSRLLLVGDGKQREPLETQCRELDIIDYVQFLGFCDDIKPLMTACDVVLVPSLKEGFGLAAVEAMALESPVIASATGGLPEIVVEGLTGLLVQPGSPEALSAAMGRLLSDPKLRLRMGKAGRERAVMRFDRQKQYALLREKLVLEVCRR